jgi:hypothetical protein
VTFCPGPTTGRRLLKKTIETFFTFLILNEIIKQLKLSKIEFCKINKIKVIPYPIKLFSLFGVLKLDLVSEAFESTCVEFSYL